MRSYSVARIERHLEQTAILLYIFRIIKMALTKKVNVVVLFALLALAVLAYVNRARILITCTQEIVNLERAGSLEKLRGGNVDMSSIDETKVSSLAKMLQERLDLITEGKWPKRNLICEDINSTAPCKSRTPCARPWETRTHQQRVRELLTLPRLQLSPAQLDSILKLSEKIPEKDLIIASAISSNHFDEMQSMFQNLHEIVYPRIKNFHMVLFDIGLSPLQRNITQKNCRCQIVKFNFDLFPPHVSDIRCYSWKPIIFRAVIAKARKLFVYQDSSIRWSTEFPKVFERALKYGQQTVAPMYGDNVPSNSMKQTLDYLNEDVCAMRQFEEMQAGIQMNRHDNLVIEALLNPWAKCALEDSCICPIKPSAVIRCTGQHLHRCHRFDQSAFNTLMAKLYGSERYKMSVPLDLHPLKIMRGDRNSTYFKK
ncbi:hypothetical protein EGW08_007035 [Elysia chlorotica]|uniref:Uncharacterized protein n=1 Tax=Elysia chlorotica TaxID=188477 RepID=A0A3S1BJE4_ELYCH|nr:hypothetical protein EGW08_007035 [Elysia chlorotica]